MKGEWLAGGVDGGWGRRGVWVELPAEERAEGEVLHDGEFGEDFCVVHFDHAL